MRDNAEDNKKDMVCDEIMKTETENFKFMSHRKCEYFPCHAGADEDNFNCLFCYCPLYALGDRCGGNFRYLSNGRKDCSECLIPHRREGYDHIMAKYEEVAKLASRNAGREEKERKWKPENEENCLTF